MVTAFMLGKCEAVQLSISGLILAGCLVAVAFAPGPDDRSFVVVFPPWTSAADAVSAATDADARLVRLPGPRFVVAVVAEGPSYAGAVRARGALVVVPTRLAAGCAAPTRRGRRT